MISTPVATPQPHVLSVAAIVPSQYLSLTQPLMAGPPIHPFTAPQLSMTIPPNILYPGFPAMSVPMSPGFGQAMPGLPSLGTPVLSPGQALIFPSHIAAVALQPLTQVPPLPVHPMPPSVGLPHVLGQAVEPLPPPGDAAYQVLPFLGQAGN